MKKSNKITLNLEDVLKNVSVQNLYDYMALRMVEEIYDCEDRIDDYTSYLEEIRFTDHITSNSKEEKTDHEKSIKFWKKRKLYYSNLHDFLKKSEVVLKKMHKETENFPHWYK